MNWTTLPPDIREAALNSCTPDELDALKLYALGYGYRAIGRALGITRDTARNRLERASRKIRDYIEQEVTA